MPVSFTETISNWPRKAGNHVPYEKGSILCESMRCVPGVPRLWQWNTKPQDISEMQEPGESLHSAAESREKGSACPDQWCFTGSQKIQEIQLWIFFFLRLQHSHLKDIWSFSTSQSPLKPCPEQRWIHQEAAFPLQISTKISCYYKRALDWAAPLHSSFINRGIASALRSSQPTWDRQNTVNPEKEDEQKWWKRSCCLEVWSWLRNKSFVESSSKFSSLSRLRLEQPTKWMSNNCNSNPWLLRDSKCWVH